MSEQEYVNVTNLAHLTAIVKILNDMMIFKDDPVVPLQEWQELKTKCAVWRNQYHDIIEIKDDGS